MSATEDNQGLSATSGQAARSEQASLSQTRLHLLERPFCDGGSARVPEDTAACSDRSEKLCRLEHALNRLWLEKNRSEAVMWLTESAASFEARGMDLSRAPLMRLLPSAGQAPAGGGRQRLAQQLLLMLCEEEPRAVGRVIAAHPHVLKDFFARRPGAMQIWFGQFSMAGIPGFRGGAKGLARFALARREEAWQHLVWEGKHPQAPVTVAAKPHYFCELSVSRTVRNLLLRCDGFLESHEMRECIEEGDFLVLDSEYFAKALLEACESGETLGRDAAQLMSSSALELPFWRLARKLLHLLDERDLLRVVNGLDRGRHEPKPEDRGRSRASVLPAELLAFAEQWERLDDALLFNALAANPRQLLALLRGQQQQQEEEDEEEGNAEGGSCGLRGVEELCMGLRSPPACDAFAGSAEAASVRELLLESWAHLCVADLCARKGPEALSSLLRRSGLQCEAGDESRARLSEHARRKKRRRKSHERPSRRLEPEWALEGAGEGLPATWLVTLSGDPRWEGVKLRGSEAAEELRGRALARWCSASEGRGVAEAPRVRESRDPA